MDTKHHLVAGVELGGTKCVCTLAVQQDIRNQAVIPTRDPDQTIAAIERVLGGWFDASGFTALGIASFGPVDLDRRSPSYGTIASTTKPGWPGADVAGRLERRFGVPTAFDTDVNGAALAETRWGAARGLADFAYVTVGTGVGVGLVVNGRAAHGFGHSEMGHLRVQRLAGDSWPGHCSFHGDCVEGLASGPAIQAHIGGREVGLPDPEDAVWATVAHALAQLCHALVVSTAPVKIAIGGGVVEGQPHLLNRIERSLVESLAGYVKLPGGGPYVVSPGLGAQAGPLGSIALALEMLESRVRAGLPLPATAVRSS